jgi:hypothetical protein
MAVCGGRCGEGGACAGELGEAEHAVAKRGERERERERDRETERERERERETEWGWRRDGKRETAGGSHRMGVGMKEKYKGRWMRGN